MSQAKWVQPVNLFCSRIKSQNIPEWFNASDLSRVIFRRECSTRQNPRQILIFVFFETHSGPRNILKSYWTKTYTHKATCKAFYLKVACVRQSFGPIKLLFYYSQRRRTFSRLNRVYETFKLLRFPSKLPLSRHQTASKQPLKESIFLSCQPIDISNIVQTNSH